MVGLGADNDPCCPTHTNSREPARIKIGYKPKMKDYIGEFTFRQEDAVRKLSLGAKCRELFEIRMVTPRGQALKP